MGNSERDGNIRPPDLPLEKPVQVRKQQLELDMEQHTGHSKHPLPTTHETTPHMDITEIRLIIFFAAKDGEALSSQQKTRPGDDCGSDHELLIAKFRLKLKKVEKTTRPFR